MQDGNRSREPEAQFTDLAGRRKFLRYGVGGAAAVAAVGASHADRAGADPLGVTAHHADHAAGGNDAVTPASIHAMAVDSIVVNVKDSGATGNGVTDDRAAIQTALDSLSATGGTAYFPPGTYRITIGPSGYGIGIPSKVKLQGAGAASTKVKLANSQTGTATIMTNKNIAGGDEDITVCDITIDGNSANQSGPSNVFQGVQLWRTRRARLHNVVVKNCRGLSGSGSGETFHIHFVLGTDNSASSCSVIGDDGGDCASGFSNDGTTGTRLIDCEAVGMTHGQGFTHNQCTDITYIACRSYLNGNGFNHEVSDAVVYSGCVAGGVVIAGTGGPSPYPASTILGNLGRGWILNGSGGVASGQLCGVYLNSCIADRNGLEGVVVDNASAATYVHINGGSFTNNCRTGGSTAEIDFWSHATDTSYMDPMPNLGGGALNDDYVGLYYPSGSLPLNFPAVPASGGWIPNHYPFTVDYYLLGGSNVSTYLNESAVQAGTSPGLHRIRAHKRIGFLYAAPPTSQVWPSP